MQNTSKIRASAHAFGTILDGRTYGILGRVGYQSSEKDDEVKGNGNSYTTEYRILDTRLGRWFSVEPEFKRYAGISTYSSMQNSPIQFNDENGDIIRYSGNIFFRVRAMVHVKILAAYSPTAALMIHKMSESPNVVTIKKLTNSIADKAQRETGATTNTAVTNIASEEKAKTAGVGSDVDIYLSLKNGAVAEAKKSDPGVSKLAITADEFSTAARAVDGKLIEGYSTSGVSNEDIEAVKESNAVRIEIQDIIDASKAPKSSTTDGTDLCGKPNEIFKDVFGNKTLDPQKDAEERASTSQGKLDQHKLEDKQKAKTKSGNKKSS
ncbi:hypothetical protein BH10BAC1_BH10BAC1_16110 [soil metagenome]